MPSIGAATAIAVARRIDEAVKETFDAETRRDAYRFLALSSRGGDTNFIKVTVVFGGLFTAFFTYLFFTGGGDSPTPNLPFMLASGLLTTGITYLLVLRRRKAQKKLDALVASNPGYWIPLSEKLQQVVLEAGRFEDGLPPSQATRIVQ